MVFKYKSLEMQDPHALVLLGFGLREPNITEEIIIRHAL